MNVVMAIRSLSAPSKRVRVTMTAERAVHVLFRNFTLSGLTERSRLPAHKDRRKGNLDELPRLGGAKVDMVGDAVPARDAESARIGWDRQ
jgi:hypothetical protein